MNSWRKKINSYKLFTKKKKYIKVEKRYPFNIFQVQFKLFIISKIIASKDFATGIISVSSISREIRESEQVHRTNCHVSIVAE